MRELTSNEIERISGGNESPYATTGLSAQIAVWLAANPPQTPSPIVAVGAPIGGIPGDWGTADPRESQL